MEGQEERCMTLVSPIKTLTEKMEDLENGGPRKNTRILGLLEGTKGK